MFREAPVTESQLEGTTHWERFESEARPHVASLFRIARWLTRNQTEAEDLLQETLLEALRSFHRFTQGTNCRAWLVSIMYHHQSKKRRAAIHLHLVSDAEERIAETIAFEEPAPQNLTDEEVLSALRRSFAAYQVDEHGVGSHLETSGSLLKCGLTM